MSNTDNFEQFLKRREEIGQAYVSGDAEPLNGIVTHHNPATFFDPGGHYTEGARKVAASYEEGAKSFASGSEGHFEILHSGASDDIAYWVGFQKAMTRMKGKDEPVPFNLRITEIFRRENGEWKLIHRHADMVKEG